MTVTEENRRSDSLYYGDIKRRELCNIIARMESEKEKQMLIKVKLDEGAYLPERAHSTDAGADIRCMEGFVLPSKGSVTVKTGVHVQLPKGTVGMLKSKSGLNIKHGITSEGVIDEGFDGEIMVKLYNDSPIPHHFAKGDKITQLVVMPVCYPTYAAFDAIQGGERGSRGYGSTGR